MLCNNCHSSNVAGARFCSTCGAALSDDYRDVVTKGVEVDDENVYGYDDGFSVKQSDIKEQRKDYEYYSDYNDNQNAGYNNGYNGGYNNGYNYNYNYGYGETPLRQNTRSAGAIVIYMISGALALLSMLLPILPNVKVTDRNVFKIAYDFLDSRSFFGSVSTNDDKVTGVLIIMMFVLPMLFQLLWAIFSFCRIRAAGSMGIVGAITYIAAGIYWLLFLMNELPIGKFYVTGTTEKVKTTAAYSGLSMDLKDAITVVPYLMIALGVAGIVMSILQVAKRNRVR